MRNQTIVSHMFDALESGLGDEVIKGDKVMDQADRSGEGYSQDMAKEV